MTAVPHTYDLRDRLTNLGGTTLTNVPFAADYTPGVTSGRGSAGADTPSNAPAGGESSSGSSTTYYALDALARTGTQPAVGAFVAGSTYEWNLLTPSGEVVGRQPASGGRLYYHKDLLGSTRAVVDASGAVKEARMYDAWGLTAPSLMFLPGSFNRPSMRSGARMLHIRVLP